MKFTIASTIALLAASAAALTTCPADKHRICCQNLDERGTGYYCGMPQRDGDLPCGGSLIPLCCETSGNYPRGYVGNNCEKGAYIVATTETVTVTECPAPTAA
ncbi:hypothetical protein BJ508DRAFT_417842 [Ascobolus immersus RN42]|uniref:Uncharacterized protein n=1 Tax=Ascobolus immersus RN42 TaxID=1160509 RepID=A0A3N4HRK8_ASCIM|nr:hypothetical protein BJ508DRAFT_417842 [Ascobolus immersus RN42]